MDTNLIRDKLSTFIKEIEVKSDMPMVKQFLLLNLFLNIQEYHLFYPCKNYMNFCKLFLLYQNVTLLHYAPYPRDKLL